MDALELSRLNRRVRGEDHRPALVLNFTAAPSLRSGALDSAPEPFYKPRPGQQYIAGFGPEPKKPRPWTPAAKSIARGRQMGGGCVFTGD